MKKKIYIFEPRTFFFSNRKHHRIVCAFMKTFLNNTEEKKIVENRIFFPS